MSTTKENQPRVAEREEEIKRQIVGRTGGRIQTLAVESSEDCVVIRGRAPCYYLKQLVLQVGLDLINTGGATRVEIDIQVLCGVGIPTDKSTILEMH
jgi:hypothetical protein